MSKTEIAVPGQYITPLYTTDNDNVIHKFIAGRGTTISQISASDDDGTRDVQVIVATLLGKIKIKEIENQQENESQLELKNENITVKSYLVTVTPKASTYQKFHEQIEGNEAQDEENISINLPREGDIVLARVIRLNNKQASCEILTVENYGNVGTDSGLGANGESSHKSVSASGGSQSLNNYSTVASSNSLINATSADLGETFKGIIRVQDIRSTERDKVKIIESFRPGDIVRAQIISLGDGSNYYLSTARNDLGVIYAKSEGGAGDLMFAIDWQTMVCPSTGIIEKRKCAKYINN
ncbi:Piso0_001413 [Millerozyma farinosa CBS 7064]|uniref:Piso0_001413 protein n=1 Tax=Pichia sorbitophila (strain ATCC MYA-4447 / BCRC 22081 / CBS 7064 / NBRC 10061 / NRRL Y-12695) TaxID=559304 RepID=G8YN38_PICSO|nr:Piso0_001413 [Millerozyma farinosa CBS 7064]